MGEAEPADMGPVVSTAAPARPQAADDRHPLVQLADRVRRLCPDRRDPEAFHVEKDAIERELRRLVGQRT